MTKIYLVTFENKNGETWNYQAFTNLRKAQNYQRYRNAVMKNEKKIYLEGDRTKLITLNICNDDYLEDAIEEEMKKLPY